jgi:hypothetical protein
MADYEFSAKLNATGVEQTLRSMEDWVARLTNNSVGSFGRMEKALLEIAKSSKAVEKALSNVNKEADGAGKGVEKGTKSGSAGMGVLAGATAAVTAKLLEMGQAAVRGFADIIKGGIEAAKTLETTTTSLTGILGGDPKLALAAMDRIRQESIRLGVDLTELAPAFLPKVEDLDQFAKIGELVAGLSTLDPAQGQFGARIALNEALAGDLVSLRRRFEIDIGPIRAAQEEFGELEGLLIGLDEVLKSRGQDFETLSQTATVAMNQTKQIGEDVKTTFGEPILEALKEDFQGLNEFLLENKDTIDIIAGSLGDLVADIADLSGDQLVGFLEGLNLGELQEFILGAQNLLDIIQTIQEVQAQSQLPQGPLGLGEDIGEKIGELFSLEKALNAVLQIMTRLNATAAAGIAAVSGYFDIITGIASGDIEFDQLSENLDALQASIKTAASEATASANDSIGEMNERIAENTDRLQERIDAQNESNEADLDAANSFLANQQALEAEAKAAEEAAAAQEKYNDAREEFEIDKERAGFDLQLKQQRALLDAEIDFAQKREDIARKNAAAIEDIYRKNKQRISDAAVDLRRDEEDIARKGARQQIEIEREAANRRVEIETDFRRELQRIRDRFDFDGREAIRKNDAVAFLDIQRQKDFELSQARTQRDEEVQDAEGAAVDQRQKLQEQLQLQIEDARIANQRKLEDLRVSLQRELQEQQIKYAREVQEARIAEERKRQELSRTFQQQKEDFDRAWERKLQDLVRNYQRELQIIQQYEAQKAQLMAQSRARSRAQQEAESADRVLLQNYQRGSTSTEGVGQGVPALPTGSAPGGGHVYTGNPNASDPFERLNRTGPGRQFGGRVSRGLPYLVGERGIEAFVPDQSGTIYPNYRVKFNPSTAGATNNITNNRQTNFNVDALMSTLSPQQIALVQQMFNQLGMSIYS